MHHRVISQRIERRGLRCKRAHKAFNALLTPERKCVCAVVCIRVHLYSQFSACRVRARRTPGIDPLALANRFSGREMAIVIYCKAEPRWWSWQNTIVNGDGMNIIKRWAHWPYDNHHNKTHDNFVQLEEGLRLMWNTSSHRHQYDLKSHDNFTSAVQQLDF